MPGRLVLASLSLAVACGGIQLPSTAAAQSAGPAPDQARFEWEVAPFVGYAQNSPVGTSWGVTPDRDHLFLGMHLAAPVLRVGSITLSYAPNVVPLVRLTNNPRYREITPSGGGPPIRVEDGRAPVYGAGIAPLGLRLDMKLHERLTVSGGGATGGLWFTRPVPRGDTRSFNFTLEWGGGLDARIRERLRLQIGYKFHHLSNLYTVRANPGVDAHLFYVGVPFAVALPR